MFTDKKIKFLDSNKITVGLVEKYMSKMERTSGFFEFMKLYKQIYDNQSAEIIKEPFIDNENNSYYVTILMNGQDRTIFYEFVKHFTNLKNYIILDDNLFKL